MQEDMRLRLPAAWPEKPEVNAAAARLLAALGVEGDVDARALAALRQAHAPGSYGPDHVRRAVEDVLGDLVYEDVDWTAVEAFRRAHLPAAALPPGAKLETQPAWWTDRQSAAFGAVFGDFDAKLDRLTAAVHDLAARTKPGTLTLDGATIDLARFLKAGNGTVTLTGTDGTPLCETLAPAADLAARLDGLKAAVDALNERLDGKAGKKVRGVGVIETHTVSGRGTVWVIHHDYDIRIGSLVQSAGNPGSEGYAVMKVTGIDVASPPGKRMGIVVKPAKEG